MKKRVLLHICCGVCATSSIDALKSKEYSVAGFFYNPNIQPEKEYLLRKQQAKKITNLQKIDLIESSYDLDRWKTLCGQLKEEKEGERRCNPCFQLRLKQTWQVAKKEGFDYFTSTLTISPHKNSQKIFQIGEKIGSDSFLKIDFKKKDGFKKANEIAKKLNLYRQNYCGCIYSLRDRDRRSKNRGQKSANKIQNRKKS